MYTELFKIPSFPDKVWSTTASFAFFRKWVQEDYPLNLSPPYQRKKVWTEYQKIAWLEYIIRGGKYGRDIHLNGKGFTQGLETVLDCLDGQQRINTVFEFLEDEIPVFGKYLSEYTDGARFTNISFLLEVNVYELTDLEAVDFYISLNRGGTMHTEEDMQKAYDFKKTIQKL